MLPSSFDFEHDFFNGFESFVISQGKAYISSERQNEPGEEIM
jgi:hypothetical protein